MTVIQELEIKDILIDFKSHNIMQEMSVKLKERDNIDKQK